MKGPYVNFYRKLVPQIIFSLVDKKSRPPKKRLFHWIIETLAHFMPYLPAFLSKSLFEWLKSNNLGLYLKRCLMMAIFFKLSKQQPIDLKVVFHQPIPPKAINATCRVDECSIWKAMFHDLIFTFQAKISSGGSVRGKDERVNSHSN